MRNHVAATALFCVFASQAYAAEAFTDAPKLLKQPDTWFMTEEGTKALANVVTWQNPDGGWYKHYDVMVPRPDPLPSGTDWFGGKGWEVSSTIDNAATYTELMLLARGIRLADKPEYHTAFDRGLDYLIASQYPNGGIPQRFKLPKNYGRMITFNDDAMTNVLKLFKDVVDGKGDFAFTTAEQKSKAKAAFEKGVDCVVKCQIVINGKPTVWCQQHDPQTLAPTGARAFELPSLASTESATLVMLLMDIDSPTSAVKRSIDSAVAWFEANKIPGKKWAFVDGPQYEGGRDRLLLDDPSAKGVWARFTDIDSGKPFFVARDGLKHWDVTAISRERRVGYAWYSVSPQKVLDRFAKWKAKNES